MADRTSAEIFSRLFEELAKPGELSKKKLVKEMWEFSSNFDFCPSQMDIDDILIELGLAYVVCEEHDFVSYEECGEDCCWDCEVLAK